VRVLVAVTGLPEADLSAMIGRILPFTALILPFWLVRWMTNWRQTFAVWPALLVCGVVFGLVQFYWSNFQDAALVDIVGGMATMGALALFFRVWQPRRIWLYPEEDVARLLKKHHWQTVIHAWSPYILLSFFVILWGMPPIKSILDLTTLAIPVPELHQAVVRAPPVVAETHAEPAVFDVAWLSAVGTATFFAGLISGPILGLTMRQTFAVFGKTCYRMRYSMVAILAMLGLGFVTRYSGMDAVMGLAMTHTGWLFPFFGTLLGWLGVALTGTDAGSNALFGSLQVITANSLNLNPVLMASANSAGGVMGKMIDAQSIIVGAVAVGQEGREGDLFRAVLWHSIALATIVGLIVFTYAYYATWLIPHGRTW